MKFTLKKNGIIKNIIDAPNGYTNPDFDVSAFSPGDEIPAASIRTHNRQPTRAQFIGLFSDDAWDTIKSHPSKKLKKWIDQIMTMSAVDLDDPIVTGGVAALETNNVINSTEAGIVLAGIEL